MKPQLLLKDDDVNAYIDGSCQSQPFEDNRPFYLSLRTSNETYTFWCAPYVHYHFAVYYIGWLVDGILVLMTNMYAIIFCLKETPVRIFFCVAISMGLLASGIYDVIHYTRIAKFCKNDAPNLDYAMDVEEVKCHSIGFLIFSASEVIVMIFVLINQAVIGIYYYKTRDRKSQD